MENALQICSLAVVLLGCGPGSTCSSPPQWLLTCFFSCSLLKGREHLSCLNMNNPTACVGFGPCFSSSSYPFTTCFACRSLSPPCLPLAPRILGMLLKRGGIHPKWVKARSKATCRAWHTGTGQMLGWAWGRWGCEEGAGTPGAAEPAISRQER